MVRRLVLCWVGLGACILFATTALGQQVGSIQGVVRDADFDAPLPLAQITIIETGQKATSGDAGNYILTDVPEGVYTITISKDGYTTFVKGEVAVQPGVPTELAASLTGDFEDMEEFIVRDIELGLGTEAGLLQIRVEVPTLLDAVGRDLMSRAGVGDVASALNLVTGATVADGKYAVVRGLPDRFVSAQLNGVRLPTADLDKRAVELDQFPTGIVESVQVSKTFTPDQQGDASGGAVNIVMRGIPEKPFVFKISGGASYNTQRAPNGKFLTYKGGGLTAWGYDDGSRDILPAWNAGGADQESAAGVWRGDQPYDYKSSIEIGGRIPVGDEITVGGFATMFYERDSGYRNNGLNQTYHKPFGVDMRPKVATGYGGSVITQLYDMEQGSQQVQWGALGTAGIEIPGHKLTLVGLYTRTSEDAAILGEDVRGSQLDPATKNVLAGNADPEHFGLVRKETLRYQERAQESIQLRGEHTIPMPRLGEEGAWQFLEPQFDWQLSQNKATFDEPDRREFSSMWYPSTQTDQVFGVAIPVHLALTPDGQTGMGWFQRVYREIEEENQQMAFNLKFPFEQWTGTEGYFKAGYFNDDLKRNYDQDSFSNFSDPIEFYVGEWEDLWSEHFAFDEFHNIEAATLDVDYIGHQRIAAWYGMLDLPLNEWVRVIGGVRHEHSRLQTIVTPDTPVASRGLPWWVPPGSNQLQFLLPANYADANANQEQTDLLPSISLVVTPIEQVTFRAVYTETVARQTFKELTPIAQQEYAGGDVFIGNPNLRTAKVQNWDLRLDYRPYEGGLLSVSWFKKDVRGAIEYVIVYGQDFTATNPRNYPHGTLSGFELELRQDLGFFNDWLTGLAIGANATFINSQVTLPNAEANALAAASVPIYTRDMTNTPSYLYNLFLTYDVPNTGTQFGIFYTERGDSLISGASLFGVGNNSVFTPSVYELGYGTLNLTVSQKLFNDIVKIGFSAKNLLDPDIQTVYRSEHIGSDVLKSSYKKGIDLSFSVSAQFEF